ncbi:MAG: VCBS repeat-containing protein, partial [Chitinophagaceae bacterium]|nr:VCBS repeat-containing protein [Chitinophagaceae bacterium]
MRFRYLLLILAVAASLVMGVRYLYRKASAGDGQENTLFRMIDPDSSGVHFTNTITTTDSLNIFTYEYLYNGGGVAVADFNNDGLPDLFFSGNMVPDRIYLNKGHFKFEDVTETSGINPSDSWSFGVSVADVNQDGLMDIYVCMGGPGYKKKHPDRLYINLGNFKFKESAKEYGFNDDGQSIQSLFFDYDHDGDLDMYLLKGGGFDKSPITARPIEKDGLSPNTDKLYRNDPGPGTEHPIFTDVSKEAGIMEEGYGLGVSLLDINEDGWPDIY